MYYGGESNVPGAPGNLMAGSPGYFLPEADIQRRMQERFYQTPAGQGLMERTDKLKQKIQEGNFRPQVPMASNPYQGGVPMGNAGFFAGPQYGQQVPPGFQNKIVS
jgi:hypothetical protein